MLTGLTQLSHYMVSCHDMIAITMEYGYPASHVCFGTAHQLDINAGEVLLFMRQSSKHHISLLEYFTSCPVIAP